MDKLMSRLENADATDVLKAGGLVALGVFFCDCYSVWRIYSESQKFYKNTKPSKEEVDKLKEFYRDDVETIEIRKGVKQAQRVNKQQFNDIVEAAHKARLEFEKGLKITSIHDPRFKVLRESVLFVGGARAVFMQNAHPYISTSIVEHVNVPKVLHKRYVDTFSQVIDIVYSDWDVVFETANKVRQLHAKVVGELKEDVGIFTKGQKYYADNFHALYWVHLTLIENFVHMYELYVGKLTDAEKDLYLQLHKPVGAAFGIRPEAYPATFAEMRNEMANFINSGIVKCTSSAHEIEDYFFTPKNPSLLKPFKLMLGSFVRWTTKLALPGPISLDYYGKEPSFLSKTAFVLYTASIRFIYRLLPRSFRYFNPFISLCARAGVQLWPTGRFLNHVSGTIVLAAVDFIKRQ